MTFAPGATTALVTVTVKGDTRSEVDETFNLVLSNPRVNAHAIATAIGTIINDDGVSVAAASASETNADTQFIFTVSLSGPSTEPTTVAYATADGTATAEDEDYVPTSGTLTFAPGETTALVTVTINGDTKSELNETFSLMLSNPSANLQLIGSTAIGTIFNDDGVSVAAASTSETNADTQLIFTVSLSGPSTEPTTVAYATADGTATAEDEDYVPTSGTLTFAPGETTALVTVTVGNARLRTR